MSSINPQAITNAAQQAARPSIPHDPKTGKPLPLEQWSYEQCLERLTDANVSELEAFRVLDRAKVIKGTSLAKVANERHNRVVQAFTTVGTQHADDLRTMIETSGNKYSLQPKEPIAVFSDGMEIVANYMLRKRLTK